MSQRARARYVNKITKYNYDRLLELWDHVVNGDTRGWGVGKAFEYLVIRAFELEGAEVRWPYSVRVDGAELEQIDGAVYFEGLSCLVESKDQIDKISIEPIAKMRNQLLRRPGPVIGSIFSRSGFTDPAATLARFTAPQTILLWDGEELGLALEKKWMRRALVAKYRACIEHGLRDYNIKLEGLP
jgi:hypothetical protein